MTLLKEIQIAAVDSKADISTLLRQCKILAVRLGNKDFEKWVDNELNGYKSNKELPEYRILRTESYGNFSDGYTFIKEARIPSAKLPEEQRAWVDTSYLIGSISGYASLINPEKRQDAQERWPANSLSLLKNKIYNEMFCLDAWKLIPHGSLVALIDTIRTRVLNFVLEIESQAPDAGESPPNTPPLPQEKVSQVFNTYISGNVQNVATGSNHVTQSGEFVVISGDFASLKNHLASLGVEETDIKNLNDAIQADSEPGGKPSFGKRVQSWLGEMVGKAASGAWEIGTSAASSALGKALSDFFG